MTRVEPGDMLVANKRRLSAFYPTHQDFSLRNQRINPVVLEGGFADCCVFNIAFDANNHNYRVIVLRDQACGTDEDLEAAALSMLSLHLGLVMESQDLLVEWRERRWKYTVSQEAQGKPRKRPKI